MSKLFFDCTHGVMKDTFASSLIALLPDPEHFIARLNELNLPGCKFDLFVARERGTIGVFLSLSVEDDKHNHGEDLHASHVHHHHSLEEVQAIIDAAGLSDEAKSYAFGVYDLLADGESKAHGVSVADVHFHEVGGIEAIAYICASCMAMSELSPEEVWASEVCTGFGFVDCAHGRLSIPAPATANILESVPTFEGKTEGELTTPTGAALVRYFANGFGEMPDMKVEAFGFGVGRAGLDSKSTLRAVIGQG